MAQSRLYSEVLTKGKRCSASNPSLPARSPIQEAGRYDFRQPAIHDWLKKNPKYELERAEDDPIYYSTELKDEQVKLLEAEANKKTLKTDKIQDTLTPPLCLLEGFPGPPKDNISIPYLDIEIKCLMQKPKLDETNFLCQSGLLVQVGLTPYNDTGLKIAIEKVGNTICMYRYPSDSKPASTAKTPEEDRNTYAGLRFEHYLTEKPDDPFDPHLKFGALVKAKLGDHKLIISGEIDCVDEEGDVVELKTTKHDIRELYDIQKTQWWLQCYFLGAKTIVVGKRDDKHECASVRRLPVSSLVKPIAPQNLADWAVRSTPINPQICLGAIHKFLTVVDKHLQGNSTTTKEGRKVFLFKRKKNPPNFSITTSENHDDEFINDEMLKLLLQG